MWTDVFAARGKRTSAGAQTFAVVGPRWQGRLPNGVAAIRSPTAIVLMAGRTQVNGKADLARGLQVPKRHQGRPARPVRQTLQAAQGLRSIRSRT